MLKAIVAQNQNWPLDRFTRSVPVFSSSSLFNMALTDCTTATGEYFDHLLHQPCFRSVKRVPQSLTLLIRDTQDQNNDHANFFFVAVNRSMYLS